MDNKLDKMNKEIYHSIKELMITARNNLAREVNNVLVKTYWEIGRIIVEDEQGNLDRAEYGKTLLKNLSKMLTKEFGRGFLSF